MYQKICERITEIHISSKNKTGGLKNCRIKMGVCEYFRDKLHTINNKKKIEERRISISWKFQSTKVTNQTAKKAKNY